MSDERQVWKYDLNPSFEGQDYGIARLSVPTDARFLSVGVQGRFVDGFEFGPKQQPVAWFMVRPNNPPVERTFIIAPTGGRLPEKDLCECGMFFTDAYVWHVFEMLPDTPF